MTHKQAMQRIRSMMPEMRKAILAECERLLTCGAVDLQDYSNDDMPFRLPKLVLTTALVNESRQYSPLAWDKAGLKELKNLSHF